MLTARYIEFVLRNRIWVLAICGVATIAAIGIISQGTIASSLIKLFFGESEAYDRYRILVDEFGDNDVIVVAFDDPTLLKSGSWDRLDTIAENISGVEFVKDVYSLLDAQSIVGSSEELEIRSYRERFALLPEQSSKIQQALLSDKMYKDLLISHDAKSTMVLVELTHDKNRPIEALPGIVDDILGKFVEQGFDREKLHLGGMIAECVETTHQAQFNIVRIFPFTALVLVVVVFLLFLQLWPVVITTGVAIVSTAWTFAFAVLLDKQINLMMTMVPAVMMVVSFSDIIHLCSAYILELRDGGEKHAAIVKSGSEVGLACFYTSITTLIGFGALVFVPTPVLRQMGLVLGFGVGIALVLAVTLVPICFVYMKQPKISSGETRVAAVVDRMNWACLKASTSSPVGVALGFATLLGLSIWGSLQMNIETNLSERLSEDNHIQRAQRFITDRFVGTNFVELYLTQQEGDWLDPALIAKVAQVQDQIEMRDDVSGTVSLVDLFKTLHQEMASAEGGLPSSRQLLAQYLLLFEMSGGENIERLIDDDREVMRLTVRVPHTDLVATAAMANEIGQLAQDKLGPNVLVEATGMPFLLGDWIRFVVAGQRRGLLFAFITTTIMMILALRQLGAGLVSMIPNALPLLVLGGYLGIFWEKIDSDTIMIGMIAIGIAVDDTIHFMTRLKLECAQCASIDEALERTFHFTGRAIVKTTVILCCGFLPFASSDYFSTRIMGSMLPMVLFTALFADLLLVPALVKLRILRMKTPPEAVAHVL
jgi:predicted RND superfamily exporter protein